VTETLRRLELTIMQRRDSALSDTSYVAKLQRGGMPLIARKLGEEAVETVVAALAHGDAALTGEAADLLFHLLVMLEARNITLADVEAELLRREGVSGLTEKALRPE
jgi:phosphoribosyl-ATP pyrophosphohydrolase